MDAELDCQKYN